MADAHANFAASLVATAPSPATSGTSLVVTTGEGALFPAVPFNATVWPTASVPTGATAEIVRVTARASDTLTITRAQEGTTARTIVVGDLIAATVTKKTLDDADGTNVWAVRAATDAPQVVRQSAAGTTADIMDWQDQGGSVVSSIGPLGQVLEGGRRLAALTSRLTSTATIASATPTSTGLSVTLVANKVYRIAAAGLWQTTATASTYAQRLNFSGTTTAIRTMVRVYTATSSASPAHQMGIAVANATQSPTATAGATGTNYPWEWEGMIRVGASGGNLVLEQTRIAGVGTCTMSVDSYLQAFEVA